MNIETSNVNLVKESKVTQNPKSTSDSTLQFAEELKNSEPKENITAEDPTIVKTDSEANVNDKINKVEETPVTTDASTNVNYDANQTIDTKPQAAGNINTHPNLNISTKAEIDVNNNIKINSDLVNNNKEYLTTKPEENPVDLAFADMNSIVKELNQSEDKLAGLIKSEEDSVDNNNNVINNDFNIQENKDLLPQMNPNMNFSGDGQPFSSFMNNNGTNDDTSKKELKSTAQDLAEEAAILSTMAENIAMANKNNIVSDNKSLNNTKVVDNKSLNDTKTITNEEGIKKVNANTGIKLETIVKYDTVIMNQADVEVFTELVQNGEVNLNNLAPKSAKKSIQISKTLADMIAKSLETNQPLRIDFDNNISVIIKISRDGKISADFLPSSQVAEAYLKENLPLLRQRFDDNNIKYEELNQKERREQNRDSNKKKDRNNE